MEKANNTVYIVHHVYQVDGKEDIKTIGAFSNYANANQAVQKLLEADDFKGDIDNFYIADYETDKLHWQEGLFNSPHPEKYMAVFHCLTTVAEENYERWDEEFQVIYAVSLEEAKAKALARANAQACENTNINGHLVKRYAAQLADIQPFIFQEENEAVYIRNFAYNRPINCNDIEVCGHYIAFILEKNYNVITKESVYCEDIYLIYGKTEAQAEAEAQERADISFTTKNEMGEEIEHTRQLVEFACIDNAPKYGSLYSRYFTGRAAYLALNPSLKEF